MKLWNRDRIVLSGSEVFLHFTCRTESEQLNDPQTPSRLLRRDPKTDSNVSPPLMDKTTPVPPADGQSHKQKEGWDELLRGVRIIKSGCLCVLGEGPYLML